MISVTMDEAKPKQIQKAKVIPYCNLDYASVRNLVSSNQEENIQNKMLPGLGLKAKRSIKKRANSKSEIIQQPRLLTTAKAHLYEQIEEPKSQTDLSNCIGLSSFLISRQITPINPITGMNRRKTITYKNTKLNSINSELFDIQSNPEQVQKGPAKFKNKDFRLFDNIIGQSEVVYRHVFGKDRIINQKTIFSWKDCLSHQDKSQIYLSINEQNKVEIPYTHSRIYQLNEIQKGLKEIYGSGKNRSLTIGQESMIIQSIERYLKICNKDPLKISRKDYDIIENILNDCKMSELQQYPMCLKQVETHFKIMATKWKYSGSLNHSDRFVESALIMGKNNFLELSRNNLLTQFLLKNSNINEI